jgi:hypothetical protein
VKQSFIHILQVKDESGITVSLAWSEGELEPNESRRVSQTWIPDGIGKYAFQFFVWESMENPKILDSMQEVMVNVT